MTARPLSQRAKLATAVPVAIVSGLWTASLVLSSAGSAATAKDQNREPLPDGSKIPAQTISTPASLPVMGTLGAAVPADKADQVIADAISSGIPAPALAAYQRSAQVVSQADKRCNLPWALWRPWVERSQTTDNWATARLMTMASPSPVHLDQPSTAPRARSWSITTDGGKLDDDGVYDRGVGAMHPCRPLGNS
jgi:hypothetical protein